MTKYCEDKELREWHFGHEIDCNGDSAKCRHLVRIGKQEYCGYCPSRYGLHQIVKGQDGCMWCKHYTKGLDSSKCAPCLGAPERINFMDTK